jgi:hypothetical protein
VIAIAAADLDRAATWLDTGADEKASVRSSRRTTGIRGDAFRASDEEAFEAGFQSGRVEIKTTSRAYRIPAPASSGHRHSA